ncbi:MAG TPA: nitrilase-related carbon-nitrogen hydrolase, partial [Rubrobacteraceae bacterium]|nr:nitrilase-related carbon-nitrogen hydrolase [Rubrobacteraceae bacterium]
MLIACAQYAVREGDPETNRCRSLAAIREAAEGGAALVVLPELSNSGCHLSSRDHALKFAEEISDGPTLQVWLRIAEETGVFIVGGLLERERDTLYNSAVIVGPGNLLGCYRKTHLWDREKL